MNISALTKLGAGLVVTFAAIACSGNVDEVDGDETAPDDGGEGGAGAAPATSTSGATSNNATSGGTNTSGSSVSTGGGEGGGGEGGGPSEVCAAMQLVGIGDPVLIDAGGDAIWSPGESAHLQVTLTNLSFADNFFYPGVAVIPNVFAVAGGENTLFGIPATESVVVDVSASADPSASPGTEVTLDFVVTTLNEPCADLAYTQLTLTLGE
jgi:hypothetical protein